MSHQPWACVVPFDPICTLASSTSSSKKLHEQIVLFLDKSTTNQTMPTQMAFWLCSPLASVHPQLQTVMEETQSNLCRHRHLELSTCTEDLPRALIQPATLCWSAHSSSSCIANINQRKEKERCPVPCCAVEPPQLQSLPQCPF